MKVTVDADRCTGHGRCYSLAPEVFEADDEGHCRLLLSDVPAALAEQARMGARNCPEDAITVTEG